VAAFEIEAEKRKTQVLLEADLMTPWIVICDPGKLRTVISNLLANAIKHANERPVRVTMEETGTTKTTSSIEISFQDEGTGLSEQHLNSIFQDFERIMVSSTF
jgi:signal transduction histidine kinase